MSSTKTMEEIVAPTRYEKTIKYSENSRNQSSSSTTTTTGKTKLFPLQLSINKRGHHSTVSEYLNEKRETMASTMKSF